MKISRGVFLVILFASCAQKEVVKKKERPNILFAISDDQSFAHTSIAGCKFVSTPNFDRVAKNGIFFSNCYAGSSGCAPSRSSIVTGRHHWQNEQAGQHAAGWLKKYVPFIDVLANNGYITGKTGKGVDPFLYAKDGDVDSFLRKEDAAGIKHSDINYQQDSPEPTTNALNKANYFENFKYFMENVKGEQPFFFWFGSTEPHRHYEEGAWKRLGKKLEDVNVPGFFPDTEVIRGDILDYAVEIEWFDKHLGMMLNYLEEIGELDNTLVIVTSDNGMPFPRAKANGYEYGIHVPMAISWPNKIPKNKKLNDLIGFVDLAPTILEVTNSSSETMQAITGKSLLDLLMSGKSERTIDKAVFSGRERHSSSRYKNLGYPQRSIRKGDYLLTWNMKPTLWPAGAPQMYDPNNSTKLFGMYGLGEDGKYINDGAFHDIDDGPSKTYLIEHNSRKDVSKYFDLAVGKRPEFELFNIIKDPYCLHNVSDNSDLISIQKDLKNNLKSELIRTKDPRMVGPNTELFDSYPRFLRMRNFPKE